MLVNLQVIPGIGVSGDTAFTSGKGLSIKGQVKEVGVPTPCRLRLFERLTGRFIAEKSTDQNGAYEFDHLTMTKFFIIAHHPTSKFNAVIQDNVVPK